jgi:hypothetical protein
MADYPKMAYAGGMGCILLALLCLLAFAFWPAFGGEIPSPVADILPIAAMLLILLGGMLAFAGTLLYVYEIATAKNDGQWKAIWIIAVLMFWLVGTTLYELFARKDRKA